MDVVRGPGNTAEEAVSRMIRLYEKDLLRLCCVILKDAALAEDAVQETFLKAYRKYGAFRAQSSEKTWLIRIAVNTCNDMKRTAWFRHIGSTVSLDLADRQSAQEPVSSALIDAVMQLPTRYKEVLLLYYYEDLTLEEIAPIVRASTTTVYRRLHKAYRLLKDLLETEIDEEGGHGFEN